MDNFRDPAEVAQDQLVVTKLSHAMAGLYAWEFITTLDYEWSIIRGHRPYRWTIWVYSLTRVAGLVSLTLNVVGTDVMIYNCEVGILFELAFGYLAIVSGSLLIVLRIIAIWNKNKIMSVIATIVWVVNVSCLIQGIARIRTTRAPVAATCVVLNVPSTKLNVVVTLSTDIVLLVIVLIGLLRLGFHERGAFGMGHLLWRQGLIWLLIATLAGVPPTVSICLNLKDPYNYMFQITSMVAMSISATRIHRHLADFASAIVDIPSKPDDLLISVRASPTTSSLIPQNQILMGMAIRTTYEHYQTPSSSHSGPFISLEGQLRDKPAGEGRNDDV